MRLNIVYRKNGGQDAKPRQVQKLVQDLDGNVKYVSTLVSILEDVGWVEQEPSGKYIITDKGKSDAQKYRYVKASSHRNNTLHIKHCSTP
jgi:Mn-dependent DtxR family transcriptional regulator